jgi:hypothetical protein
MRINRYKLIAICSSVIIVSFLFASLGYIGDLEYYSNNSDSIRNTLMNLILKPAQVFSSHSLTIAYWLALFLLVVVALPVKLSRILWVQLGACSMYLCFPSKDSLAFLMAFISIYLLENLRFRSALIFLFIGSVARPWLLPIPLFILLNSPHIRLQYKAVAVSLLALYLFPNLSLENLANINQSYYSYAHDYFASALQAGATDIEFLRTLNDSLLSQNYNLSVFATRALLPLWMINIETPFKVLYLSQYTLSMSISLFYLPIHLHESETKEVNTNNKAMILLLYLTTFGLITPLIVTNAGSAARYMSSMPIYMFGLYTYLRLTLSRSLTQKTF